MFRRLCCALILALFRRPLRPGRSRLRAGGEARPIATKYVVYYRLAEPSPGRRPGLSHRLLRRTPPPGSSTTAVTRLQVQSHVTMATVPVRPKQTPCRRPRRSRSSTPKQLFHWLAGQRDIAFRFPGRRLLRPGALDDPPPAALRLQALQRCGRSRTAIRCMFAHRTTRRATSNGAYHVAPFCECASQRAALVSDRSGAVPGPGDHRPVAQRPEKARVALHAHGGRGALAEGSDVIAPFDVARRVVRVRTCSGSPSGTTTPCRACNRSAAGGGSSSAPGRSSRRPESGRRCRAGRPASGRAAWRAGA